MKTVLRESLMISSAILSMITATSMVTTAVTVILKRLSKQVLVKRKSEYPETEKENLNLSSSRKTRLH